MDTIARDVMSTELLTGREGMSVEEALKVLMNNRITGMPVVNESGVMIGVVSEYDILKQIAEAKRLSRELFGTPIEFSRRSDAIPETMKLEEIVQKFIETKFRRLPVVDPKGKLIGIITRRDLMRVFYYRAQLQ